MGKTRGKMRMWKWEKEDFHGRMRINHGIYGNCYGKMRINGGMFFVIFHGKKVKTMGSEGYHCRKFHRICMDTHPSYYGRPISQLLGVLKPNLAGKIWSMGIPGSNWWRYVSTIFQAIFCGDIPLHSPYIGLIYGRYLQFRFLKWPLIWWVVPKTANGWPADWDSTDLRPL